MPPLPGFSDNPFLTHSDLETATYALLAPLKPYTSPLGARIRLPVATGAHFDETAAQFEGYARPLWAVGALLASLKSQPIDIRLQSWINGLKAGTNPEQNGEFWGAFQSTDQRMVELEIVGYALLAAPEVLVPPLPIDPSCPTDIELRDLEARDNIIRYVRNINGKEMPYTNWRWFRIMANVALIKTLGVSYEDVKEQMEIDHLILNQFYMGNGWAADGFWGDSGRQADYYSGSFAIQFSQLLYVKYAADLDPERCLMFKERASLFAEQFWRYFDVDGAAIPFGRSLTYRFACGGFWAALAVAEVPLPAGMTLGVVKGLLLRHLRWWSKQHDIFNVDGTLNIGYTFPNMYMSEDYNSPQSPYWCLKTLIAVSLPADHNFWTCKELPHPLSTALDTKSTTSARGCEISIIGLNEPKQMLVSSKHHHYLLSLGQFCPWPLKATHAKYCKFAYSSTFGFGVPTGPLIQQLVPDNTLAISEDDGETWKLLWKTVNPQLGSVDFLGEDIPRLSASWSPGSRSPLTIETTIVAPTKRWPSWHIRVHKIKRRENAKLADHYFNSVEGGFSIPSTRTDGTPLSIIAPKTISQLETAEGFLLEDCSALIITTTGSSGIAQLNPSLAEGQVLKPDSNTNLMLQRSLIPTINSSHSLTTEVEVISIVVGIFAVSRKHVALSGQEIMTLWKDKPIVRFSSENQIDNETAIYV